MHKLTIEDDEGKTVVVPLIRDEITIGRQDGNTIRLTERNISRKHARLFRQNGGFSIEDVGSYTGVKVNSQRLSGPVSLKDGDLVVIGDYRMTMKAERAPATLPYIPPLTIPGAGAPAEGIGPIPGAQPPAVAPNPAVAAPAPAIAAPIDGAPTIPVRTMAEERTASGSHITPARLVVMSTDLSGTDFLLDRPSLVIGRTPENDIVLNHKSISRHHAKVIRDGDRYVVVDLESANGVRVNGAERERIELNPGDVLELGHVRLRFSTGADDYAFDPGDPSGFASGAKTRTYALAAVGGLLVVGGLVFFVSGGDKKGAAPTPTAMTAEPKPAAAPKVEAAKPAPSPQAGPLLAEASAALQQEKWIEASDAATKAAALTPPPPEAAEMLKRIDREKAASLIWKQLRGAADARNFDGVLTAFAALPDDSMYKERGRPMSLDARTKVVAQHLSKAQKWRAQNKCADATREAQAVLALDAENAAARGVVDACEKPPAVVAEATPKAPPVSAPVLAAKAPAAKAAPVKPAARPVGVAPKAAARAGAGRSEGAEPAAADTPPPRAAIIAAPASDGSSVDPDALITEARQYYLREQFGAALTAARNALRVSPGNPRAYQVIAACSCSLRNKDEATKAYDKVESRDRPLVKQVCQRHGITLD